MTDTALIIQYILSALGGIALVLLIVIFIQLIRILQVASKMINKAEQTVENVEHFVATPVKIGLQIAEQVQHVIGAFQQKFTKHSQHDTPKE